jgi:hypothetical protein
VKWKEALESEYREWASSTAMGPLANRSLKRTKDEDEGPEPSSKRAKKAEDLPDNEMKALYTKNQLHKVG